MTDEERLKAYTECALAKKNEFTAIGVRFVTAVLTGNAPSALGSWAEMMLKSAKDGTDCMDVLTPNQRGKIMEEIRAQEKQKRRDRHEPR